MKKVLYILVLGVISSSCVPKKKYAALEEENARLKELLDMEGKSKKNLKNKKSKLEKNNAELISSLVDLTILSKKESESLEKSLKILERERKLVNSLESNVAKRNALNLELVKKLKKSLNNPNDRSIQIEIEKGVVYVSISGDLLFPKGEYKLNPGVEKLLSKIVKIIKDHPNFDVRIEGHTDDDPILKGCVTSNWDLSVRRAVTVVEYLQEKYHVNPSRLIASGRSKYDPVASNKTLSGKSKNRRIKVILLPKLKDVFDILTKK
jgi:chemotaxis protein MotB